MGHILSAARWYGTTAQGRRAAESTVRRWGGGGRGGERVWVLGPTLHSNLTCLLPQTQCCLPPGPLSHSNSHHNVKIWGQKGKCFLSETSCLLRFCNRCEDRFELGSIYFSTENLSTGESKVIPSEGSLIKM